MLSQELGNQVKKNPGVNSGILMNLKRTNITQLLFLQLLQCLLQ